VRVVPNSSQALSLLFSLILFLGQEPTRTAGLARKRLACDEAFLLHTPTIVKF
jgi:hypothetical protein